MSNLRFSAPISLFFFAHQDDEFGVYAELQSLIARGHRPVCVYLTDGGSRRATPQERNAESLGVLKRLGVAEQDVHFVGTEEGIQDGHLVRSLPKAHHAAMALASSLGAVDRIVVHAWEGGHEDHDAAHLVGLAVARHLGVVEKSQQFTLYRADPQSKLPFVMYRPIKENGEVITVKIARLKLFYYLLLMGSYGTQRKPFLGLWPLIAYHYLVSATQFLQAVRCARVLEKPHAGRLLYEKRSSIDYQQFNALALPFCREFIFGERATLPAAEAAEAHS
jgi:LmbE family N-acetylglucosaminyl deacetylase